VEGGNNSFFAFIDIAILKLLPYTINSIIKLP